MNYILSFIFCGLVCAIAQWIYNSTKLTPGHITCIFVCIGAALDVFSLYDKLVAIFHAGALLPITSFGHSLMDGAMKATEEFGAWGLAMGIFDSTAAGISGAIVFSFLAALIFKPHA